MLGENSNLDILNIDSRLLFLSAPIIAITLTQNFSTCHRSRALYTCIPVDWKTARVTPVFKGKGNNDDIDCTNYRPGHFHIDRGQVT